MSVDQMKGNHYQAGKFILGILLVDIAVICSLGVYFEAYDGIMSSFVSGMYTDYCTGEWFNDLHFLLFPLYAFLNQLFPGVQVYGILLLGLDLMALFITGMAIYRTMENVEMPRKYLFLLLLYLILSVENLLNLSTNRVVFYMFLGVAWNYDLLMMKDHSRQGFRKFLLLLFLIIACLMRYEMVLICSVVYILVEIARKQIRPVSFLPFALGVVVMIAVNYYINHIGSEAKRVFILRELQFVDRDDVDYDHLSDLQKIEVEAFKRFNIQDDVHFTTAFYDSVSLAKKHPGRIDLLDGVNFHSFASIFGNSFQHIRNLWYLVLAIIVVFLCRCYALGSIDRRYLFFLSVILLIPVLICFYMLVPPRVVVPYYTILFVLNLVGLLRTVKMARYAWFNAMLLIVLFFIMRDVMAERSGYRGLQKSYVQTMDRLNAIAADSTPEGVVGDPPLFIYSVQLDKFFPSSVFSPATVLDMSFVNFYYFESYGCYGDYWRLKGVKTPLSLKEKIVYLANSRSKVIANSEAMNFTVRYLYEKDSIRILPERVSRFDEALDVFRISVIPPPAGFGQTAP